MNRIISVFLLLALLLSLAACAKEQVHVPDDDGNKPPRQTETPTETDPIPTESPEPSEDVRIRLIQYNEVVKRICYNEKAWFDSDEWKEYEGQEAIKYCYDFLMNAEDLDIWIGSDYVQENWEDPQFLMMDRKELLSKFEIRGDTLLYRKLTYADALGNPYHEEAHFTYNIEGEFSYPYFNAGLNHATELRELKPFAYDSFFWRDAAEIIDRTYDDQGNLTDKYIGTLHTENGPQDNFVFCVVKYTYNPDNSIASIHYLDCNNDEHYATYSYTDGRVTSATGLWCPHCQFSVDVTYRYDAAGRLIEESHSDSTFMIRYNYDDAGVLQTVEVFESGKRIYLITYYREDGKLIQHQLRYWHYDVFDETLTEEPACTVDYIYGDYYHYPPQTHFED